MAFPKNTLDPRNPTNEQQAIVALAAFPDDKKALEFLRGQKISATEKGLASLRRNKAKEIQQAKEEIAPRLEAELTGDRLDEARRATAVIDMAVGLVEKRLVNTPHLIMDPSRVARDLAQLRTQGIDKRLALEGRPTTIVEKRSPDEILAKLEALGVAKRVDVESTAIEE